MEDRPQLTCVQGNAQNSILLMSHPQWSRSMERACSLYLTCIIIKSFRIAPVFILASLPDPCLGLGPETNVCTMCLQSVVSTIKATFFLISYRPGSNPSTIDDTEYRMNEGAASGVIEPKDKIIHFFDGADAEPNPYSKHVVIIVTTFPPILPPSHTLRNMTILSHRFGPAVYLCKQTAESCSLCRCASSNV